MRRLGDGLGVAARENRHAMPSNQPVSDRKAITLVAAVLRPRSSRSARPAWDRLTPRSSSEGLVRRRTSRRSARGNGIAGHTAVGRSVPVPKRTRPSSDSSMMNAIVARKRQGSVSPGTSGSRATSPRVVRRSPSPQWILHSRRRRPSWTARATDSARLACLGASGLEGEPDESTTNKPHLGVRRRGEVAPGDDRLANQLLGGVFVFLEQLDRWAEKRGLQAAEK